MNKNYLIAGLLSLSLMAHTTTHTAPKAAPQQESVTDREKKAFELFMDLLVCPLDKVPTWKEFVDRMAHLMEGNTKYAALRTSLLSVRDASGLSGKLKIKNTLVEHGTLIPQEIVQKTQTLKISECIQRIRL